MRPAEEPTTGYLVWRVANRWRAVVDRAVTPLGLTHAKYALLASLYGLSRGGSRPSQRELADYSGLDAIYVSKLAKALEQANLLERTENPDDPRAVQLRLTDRGTDVVLRAVDVVRVLQEEITAPIGGTRGLRNRELAATLKALLGLAAAANPHHARRDTMPQTPVLTGQDIAEAQGSVQALLEQVLDGTGRTSPEYVILRVLAVRGPYPDPAALHDFLAGQRQLDLDAPAVARLLAGLEAEGLVTGTARDGSGPAELTGPGAAAFARLSEKVAAIQARLYADIDPVELATARGVLAQVTERARRLRGEL